MRWPILHLCLCALLMVQQPTLLVTGSRGLPLAGTVSASGAGSGQLPEEEEEKVQGCHSACRGFQRLGAPRSRELPPVPAKPARWAQLAPLPPSSDAAVAHWRAALLPPLSQPDEPPQHA